MAIQNKFFSFPSVAIGFLVVVVGIYKGGALVKLLTIGQNILQHFFFQAFYSLS